MMQLCNKSDKKTTIAEWFEGSSKINNIWIKQCKLFSKVAAQIIEKPTCDWQAMWQPQITLQHPLKSSINLLDSLFARTAVL